MRALLLSTYELGHQPLHVASPAAALARAGHEVRCVDLSTDTLDREQLQWADAVAISVPMHTAMRLARIALSEIRAVAPDLPVCLYGLYAVVDDGSESSGVKLAVAGEYETSLTDWFAALGQAASEVPTGVRVSLRHERSALPLRSALPPLDRYARLLVGERSELAGYVEASHGCAHRCRHCPVPVVYDGRTRIVAVDAVLADVAQLVGLGARHITFGDPDFLNGPHHARRVVEAVHQAFPDLTFDVTVKVSHVLEQVDLWPQFAAAGCLFVVSAVESASDDILRRLDKGHTVADAVRSVAVLRRAGIEPRPSLLPFTPWTTAADYMAILDFVAHCDLIGNVDPVHYAIRLLVPPGSLLLDGDDLTGRLGPYDPGLLSWTWRAEDPRLDDLATELSALAESLADAPWNPVDAYRQVRERAQGLLAPMSGSGTAPDPDPMLRSRYGVEERPRLSEAWFCCAEPTGGQTRLAGRPLATTPTV
ncbi:MAG: CUAEP/CCAEP-tail radical SAM (seleno)protein [Acidimicrobiales bacterium]